LMPHHGVAGFTHTARSVCNCAFSKIWRP
jgi:hypothetical protein